MPGYTSLFGQMTMLMHAHFYLDCQRRCKRRDHPHQHSCQTLPFSIPKSSVDVSLRLRVLDVNPDIRSTFWAQVGRVRKGQQRTLSLRTPSTGTITRVRQETQREKMDKKIPHASHSPFAHRRFSAAPTSLFLEKPHPHRKNRRQYHRGCIGNHPKTLQQTSDRGSTMTEYRRVIVDEVRCDRKLLYRF